jgi:hypothetical protein
MALLVCVVGAGAVDVCAETKVAAEIKMMARVSFFTNDLSLGKLWISNHVYVRAGNGGWKGWERDGTLVMSFFVQNEFGSRGLTLSCQKAGFSPPLRAGSE